MSEPLEQIKRLKADLWNDPETVIDMDLLLKNLRESMRENLVVEIRTRCRCGEMVSIKCDGCEIDWSDC